MRNQRNRMIGVGCVVACGVMSVQAGPPRYMIEEIEPPPPPVLGDWSSMGGRAINDEGLMLITAVDDFYQSVESFLYSGGIFEELNFESSDLGNGGLVSGSFFNTDNRYRAILRKGDGSYVHIGTLGGHWYDESFANGVNNVGQAVGVSTDESPSGMSGWVWDEVNGVVSLDSGQGKLEWATAINDAGKIVGLTPDSEAALWDNGQITLLGSLGTGHVDAWAINNNDQVIGRYGVPTYKYRAFIWEDGVMSDLGDLGFNNVYAFDINDAGQIVGNANVGETYAHAVLWHDGQILDLNNRVTPWSGWVLQSASGINSSGQITGGGYLLGEARGFILTPTCDGDFNGDGQVDSQDFITYLNAFTMQAPQADFNNDGTINSLDFTAFLNAFVAGC